MALHPPAGRVPRVAVALGGMALAAICASTASPYAVAPLALALAIVAAAALGPASSPRGPRLGLVASLPAGFLLLVAWSLTWGLLQGATGVGGWSSSLRSHLGVGLFAALCLAVATRRRGTVELWARDWPAVVGAVLLATLAVWVASTQPIALWSRVTGSGTDFLRHLYLVREILASGGLVFGGSAYPSGLHAAGAMLVSTVGSGIGAEQLWIAIAGVAWLMLCLMLVAIMSISGRVIDRLVGPGPAGPVAAGIAGAAFVQTAWFSTFLAFGSIMNMLVAVALLALVCTGLQERVYGSSTGTLLAATAMAVTANAWQLLAPVAAAGVLVWFAAWWRRGRERPLDWLVWSFGAVLTLSGALGVLDPANGGVVSGPTVSDLFAPDWWWWAALALALGVCVVAYRHGLRSWAAASASLLIVGVVLVAALLRITGSTWELMLYYPVKALWTVSVVVIPLAVAGLVWLAVRGWAWAGSREGVASAAGRAAVVGALALVVAGVLGRGSAFPPHLERIAQAGIGMPNWSLAVVDALAEVRATPAQQEGVLVFGIVPSGSPAVVTGGYAGSVDYMVMEALRFTPVGGDSYAAPVKGALVNRDMTAVCRYLKDHPRSLRITGPNPRTGADWIRESGCPDDIVDSGTWLSLDIDPQWLQESLWQAPSTDFPSVRQVQRATRSA